MENKAISLTLTWELEIYKLITGHRSLDGEFAGDRDGYPQADGQPAVQGLPILINPITHYFDTFEQDQTSIELQISGTSLSDKLGGWSDYMF